MKLLRALAVSAGLCLALASSCGNNPAPVCPNGVHAHFIPEPGTPNGGHYSCINRHGRPFKH